MRKRMTRTNREEYTIFCSENAFFSAASFTACDCSWTFSSALRQSKYPDVARSTAPGVWPLGASVKVSQPLFVFTYGYQYSNFFLTFS